MAYLDTYLNKEYGTGIKLIKELPGDFEIYVLDRWKDQKVKEKKNYHTFAELLETNDVWTVE